jgi:hypothetical protein
VRQINFGDVDNQRYDTLDQMKALFEAGALKINVGAVPGVQQVICRSHVCCSHTRIPRVLLTPPPTCPRVYTFLTRARVSAVNYQTFGFSAAAAAYTLTAAGNVLGKIAMVPTL